MTTNGFILQHPLNAIVRMMQNLKMLQATCLKTSN